MTSITCPPAPAFCRLLLSDLLLLWGLWGLHRACKAAEGGLHCTTLLHWASDSAGMLKAHTKTTFAFQRPKIPVLLLI